jgi:hypothetical protein
LKTARRVEKAGKKLQRKDFVKGVKIADFSLINSNKTKIMLREDEDS